MELNYTAKKDDVGLQLKNILKNKLYISNILLKRLKDENGIFVNTKNEFVNYKIKENDNIVINITMSDKKFSDKFVTIKKDLNILYEDEYLLIVSKDAGIPIHPSTDNYYDTLSNYVAYYLEKKGINGIHILTRLDKNTSGICIFAKNEYIQELFLRKKDLIKLKKEYICVVNGIMEKEHNIIELPISRKKDTIILREVNKNGDHAKTEYFLQDICNEKNYSVLKILLHTGRTHQIRVHMSYIGHTLLGDNLYANENEKNIISQYIKRQALHAYKISFYHPITNEYIKVVSPIPNDILKLINNK